jgi:hypothetical protein
MLSWGENIAFSRRAPPKNFPLFSMVLNLRKNLHAAWACAQSRYCPAATAEARGAAAGREPGGLDKSPSGAAAAISAAPIAADVSEASGHPAYAVLRGVPRPRQ